MWNMDLVAHYDLGHGFSESQHVYSWPLAVLFSCLG